jgi:hypothetical protein
MSDDQQNDLTNNDQPNWRRRSTGLYLPDGVPDGGQKPPVGFIAAMQPSSHSNDKPLLNPRAETSE